MQRILGGPYRAGPWPGLTARGAVVLVAHAIVLAVLAEAWPPLSVLPVVSATWLMRMPGVATAVVGAYLLPRSLLSLVAGAELPPLLLAPSMLFDLVVWLRSDDLPRRPNRWRKRNRRPRALKLWRVLLAVLLYEAVLALAR